MSYVLCLMSYVLCRMSYRMSYCLGKYFSVKVTCLMSSVAELKLLVGSQIRNKPADPY
jgi:hypothetical protein